VRKSTFLIKRIINIVEKNELDINEWPGKSRMESLCRNSAGLFIWAVTATNFIEDQISSWGSGCLDDVLNELNSLGMGDINVLYSTILRMSFKQADSQLSESVREIVGCITVLKQLLCIADISLLLGVQNTKGSKKQISVMHLIRKLRTVLVAGTEVVTPQTIPRLHRSFFEFITERADNTFHVNLNTTNVETGLYCAQYMVQVQSTKGGKHGTVPSVLFHYALQFWRSHIHQSHQCESEVYIINPDKPSSSPFSQHPLYLYSIAIFSPIHTTNKIFSTAGDNICIFDINDGTDPFRNWRKYATSFWSYRLSKVYFILSRWREHCDRVLGSHTTSLECCIR
jgi:hypothetical protein